MKRIQTFVEENTYERLQQEAKQKNMTLSEYIRDILMKHSAVELTIDFADIDDYVEKIDQLLQTMYAFLPSLSRTGILSEQELIEWKQLLLQINTTSNDIWRYVTRMRSELYDEVRKKLYKKVSTHGYKRRRTTPSTTSKGKDGV